jgi:hypothetical protein
VPLRRTFIGIAQKNNIVAERGAANVATEFRARAPHLPWQPGDVLAVVRKLVDEVVGDRAALALALDVGRHLGYGAASGGPVNEARHLSCGRLIETVEVIARVTTHVIRREASALGLGRRELGAQLGELRLIDGVANSIFSCREAAGSELGLHPLGSIRGESLHCTGETYI